MPACVLAFRIANTRETEQAGTRKTLRTLMVMNKETDLVDSPPPAAGVPTLLVLQRKWIGHELGDVARTQQEMPWAPASSG